MKRKTLRLYLLVVSLALLGVATALVVSAINSDLISYFKSPTQVAEDPVEPGRIVRLGGLVEVDSVGKLDDGATVRFRVTDLRNSVEVLYRGVLPDLFREGQGVVVEGSFNDSGRFVAAEVLAKHDENYLPAEVVKALKESGRWQEGAAATAINGGNGGSQ